jgi:hypothetical protein
LGMGECGSDNVMPVADAAWSEPVKHSLVKHSLVKAGQTLGTWLEKAMSGGAERRWSLILHSGTPRGCSARSVIPPAPPPQRQRRRRRAAPRAAGQQNPQPTLSLPCPSATPKRQRRRGRAVPRAEDQQRPKGAGRGPHRRRRPRRVSGRGHARGKPGAGAAGDEPHQRDGPGGAADLQRAAGGRCFRV